MRRLFTAGSAYLPCLCFGIAASCRRDQSFLGAFCVSLGLACSAFNTAGWLMTFIDVAPAYASIVYSISNMIAALPGVISSTVAGAVIERTGSFSSIFAFAGVMWGLGGTVWLLRYSGTPFLPLKQHSPL